MDVVQALEYLSSPPSNSLPPDTIIFVLVVLEIEDKLRKRVVSMLEKWKLNYTELSHPDNKLSDKWVRLTREDLKNSYRLYYDS